MKECNCHEDNRTDEEKYSDILDYYYEHFKNLIEVNVNRFGIQVFYNNKPEDFRPGDNNTTFGYYPSKTNPSEFVLSLPTNKSTYQEKLHAVRTLIHEYGHAIQYGSPYNAFNYNQINSLETAKKYLAQETFAETYAANILHTIGIPYNDAFAPKDSYLNGYYFSKWEIKNQFGGSVQKSVSFL